MNLLHSLRAGAAWRADVDLRAVLSAALALGLVLLLGALLAVLTAVSSWRVAAVATAAVALPLVAQMSGNPRLFLLWCLMFALPFDLSMYFGPISDKGGGERAFRLEFADLFFLALAAFQLRDVLRRRWPGIRIPKVSIFWGLIMLRCIMTIVEGPWRTTAIHELLRMAKMLLLFIVIANELDNPRRVLHAAGAMALAVLVQSGFGLAQWLRGATFGLEILGEIGNTTAGVLARNSVQNAQVFRISAFVGHPNLLGIYLAAALPLCVAGFVMRGGSVARLWFLASGVLGLVALILTQSRSAWASFALAAVVQIGLLLMHRGMFRRSLATLTVALAALVVVVAVFQEPITKRLFDSKDDATIGRQEFNEDAKRMIDAKLWLGWGVNSYVHEVPEFMKHSAKAYGGWIPPVHNIYYLWWAETGITGLLVHLTMWLAIVWAAWRNLAVQNETLFNINLACMAGLLAFAVDGFLSFSLRVNQPLRLYWVLAGIVFAIHYQRRASRLAGPA